MAELIDEGLLKKGPNRRLMAISPRNAGTRTRQPLKLPEPPRDKISACGRKSCVQLNRAVAAMFRAREEYSSARE
jgi:hypothetical protein